MNNEMLSKLNTLKEKTDAVILAHYYAVPEVQAVADYIGDSFYLATKARELPQKTIVLAGVYFMAESAKILNPEKTVIIPDVKAGCPMADMVQVADVEKVRAEYSAQAEDLAVVCYVNSNADVKAVSDVCVTSSNAVKIVKALPQKFIYFIPDKNLGAHIASLCPEKVFISHPGFCCVHEGITPEQTKAAKEAHPGVKLLAHPECRPEVLEMADYVGSTSGILEFVKSSADEEFIIATEEGILYQMELAAPEKKFHLVNQNQFCKQMKKNTVEKIIAALEDLANSEPSDDADNFADRRNMQLDENSPAAEKALARMVELA